MNSAIKRVVHRGDLSRFYRNISRCKMFLNLSKSAKMLKLASSQNCKGLPFLLFVPWWHDWWKTEIHVEKYHRTCYNLAKTERYFFCSMHLLWRNKMWDTFVNHPVYTQLAWMTGYRGSESSLFAVCILIPRKWQKKNKTELYFAATDYIENRGQGWEKCWICYILEVSPVHICYTKFSSCLGLVFIVTFKYYLHISHNI